MGGCSAPWHGERVGVTPCDRGVLSGVNAGAVPAACSDNSSPNLLSLRSHPVRLPVESVPDSGHVDLARPVLMLVPPMWKLFELLVEIVLVEIAPIETEGGQDIWGSRLRPDQHFIC